MHRLPERLVDHQLRHGPAHRALRRVQGVLEVRCFLVCPLLQVRLVALSDRGSLVGQGRLECSVLHRTIRLYRVVLAVLAVLMDLLGHVDLEAQGLRSPPAGLLYPVVLVVPDFRAPQVVQDFQADRSDRTCTGG